MDCIGCKVEDTGVPKYPNSIICEQCAGDTKEGDE